MKRRCENTKLGPLGPEQEPWASTSSRIVLAREAADRKQMDEGGRVGRFLR
jgi:hypothetical protein